MLKKRITIPVLLFVLTISAYLLSAPPHMPYDYFTRLADAMLQGRIYLTDNPPWLNELIPLNDRYYVVYPPMPAIAAIPFRLVFGAYFKQNYLAHLMGGGIGIIFYLIAKKLSANKDFHNWSFLLVSFGSIIWFMSSVGSSWYLGQISAAFFLSLAILESLSKKRPGVVGILLGMAFISRLHTILSLPFFILINAKQFRDVIRLGAGIFPFFAFNLAYNYLRFGVLWDKAYVLIPGVLDESWYEKGIFHPSYIPRHLEVAFWKLPNLQGQFPYLIPSWGGMAIWATTPAFVYAIKNKFFARENLGAFLSIGLIMALVFMHGTTGFAQFGYRFAVDFYPILFYLTLKAVSASGPRWHHWVLLAAGIVVNLWGVVMINKLDIVTF